MYLVELLSVKELFVAHNIEHIVVFLLLESDRTVQYICPNAYVYSMFLFEPVHKYWSQTSEWNNLVLVTDFIMQQQGCQNECFYCNDVCFCIRQVLSELL